MITLTRRRRMVSGVVASVVSLGLLAGPGLAQPEGNAPPKKERKPSVAAPVLLLERAALEKMVVDPRDAGVARAIGMLPARLRELPGEIPGAEQISPPVLDFALAMVTQPGRLGLTYNAGDQTGGAFGLGLVASVLAKDAEQAQTMQGTVNALLSMGGNQFHGEPSDKYPGMSESALPVVGLLRYGPRKSGDTSRYEIHVGCAGDPETTFATLPAPARGAGFEPVLRARLDLSPANHLADQVRQMAGDDEGAEQGFRALEEVGLIGPDAVKYSYQFGYLPDRSLGVSVSEGAKKHAGAMGLATTPLTEADFRSIPADSYAAGLRRIDLTRLVQTITSLEESQPQLEEGIEKLKQATGVDLVKDVLASLGGTVGYYMADSTGGFGLMSAVAFVQFTDRAKFDAASTKLTSFANTALAQPTKGYVRARSWSEGDAKLVSITFPGVPVPLELTYTTTDRLLIVAMSPQAALAAARQAMGKGDGGLMANAGVAATLPKGKDLESVGFIDTPRTMAAGYQYVAMAGSALANVARSPKDPGREPGLVVPTYSELKQGARPHVSFAYFDGDNLVSETHGNRSLLTEACGTVGAASPLFPVVAAMVTAAAARGQAGAGEAARRAMDEDEGDEPPPPKKAGAAKKRQPK